MSHAASPSSVGFEDIARCVAQQHPRLLRFARTRLRNAASAEDAVSEAMLAVLEADKEFTDESQIVGWLFGVLRHKLVDQLRAHGRETPASDFLGDLDGDPNRAMTLSPWTDSHSRWNDPEYSCQRQQFVKLLMRCCARLPSKQAEAFVMHEFLELDAPAICERLQVQEGHLWVLLYRARGRLRPMLQRDWGIGFD